ncbi:hypothetical protein HII31_03206 [Pseudocercospora fuligena]|uniref:F-box domain-containing protein n=1 Tax=Pseudocercospora fuligena TaxID=685502 RepID=A0A8H6VP39_9PEZI|nr:hypothetical protein HII31_03206 [Pseudocercospora fuligena]
MAVRDKDTVPAKSAMHSTVGDVEPTEDLPAGAVFATTELLENILRYLPMKDLLLDQRVCKKWQAVILRSKEMQQQLFFQPREAQHKWLLGRDTFQRVPIDADESETAYSLPSGELNPLLFTAGRVSRQKYYANTPIVFSGRRNRIQTRRQKIRARGNVCW